MKLLFDANISYRIVKKLQKEFAGSLHVSRTGLTPPILDRSIWEFARKNGFTIVTFDEASWDATSDSDRYGFRPKSSNRCPTTNDCCNKSNSKLP
jgi:predicted nuclease of predicted toxin-antitoxin system